ncbi:helix-turn-helix domain-containing protein [Clostridium neonatale]|uniref:helix-turn-helix domain-containing protein n=1 Tax=Clostridium neonatale TaxID=137838 RepID=UPI001E39ABB0|nr:helix-turn-helix transcriptional regulator [Clostridium neonatale]
MYKKFESLLKERNVTAYQVSKNTGIATATLSEWKKGTYTPKADKLLKIAQYFEVPIEYFLEKRDEINE